jgi:hypothetical protein
MPILRRDWEYGGKEKKEKGGVGVGYQATFMGVPLLLQEKF